MIAEKHSTSPCMLASPPWCDIQTISAGTWSPSIFLLFWWLLLFQKSKSFIPVNLAYVLTMGFSALFESGDRWAFSIEIRKLQMDPMKPAALMPTAGSSQQYLTSGWWQHLKKHINVFPKNTLVSSEAALPTWQWSPECPAWHLHLFTPLNERIQLCRFLWKHCSSEPS